MQALIIRVVHGYTLFVTNSHGIFKSYQVSVRIKKTPSFYFPLDNRKCMKTCVTTF